MTTGSPFLSNIKQLREHGRELIIKNDIEKIPDGSKEVITVRSIF